MEEETKHSGGGEAEQSEGLSRRDFVKRTGTGLAVAAGAGAGLFGGQPPARGQRRTLHILEWSSFISEADAETDRQAAEFGKAEGINVKVEHINANDLNARATAAVESGTGPDVFRLQNNQPQLYASGLANHDAVLQELGGDDYFAFLRAGSVVDGTARGVPNFFTGGAWVFRRDVFEEAGAAPFTTWEQLRRDGEKLKDLGYPVGQALGHSFGDPIGFASALMWSFGGRLVDEDDRVDVNNAGTREAINWLKDAWGAAFDEGGLAWDDGSNNRAFFAQTISATLNGASIYFVAKRNWVNDQDPFRWRLFHFLNPEGPAGRFHTATQFHTCVADYSAVQSAGMNYIRYIAQEDNFERFLDINNGYVHGPVAKWHDHPVWTRDPALTPFRDMFQYAVHQGYPGSYDRRSSEAVARYIAVDMFARAVKGDATNATIRQAEQELRQIYG